MQNIILQNITIEELRLLITDIVHSTTDDKPLSATTDKGYLTREEVAKLLRISLPTLHDWTKTGTIKAYRIGRRVLYKENEVNSSLHSIISNKYKKQ